VTAPATPGSNPDPDADRAAREQRAWESIVADLSGQLSPPAEVNEPVQPLPGPTVADRDETFVNALLGDGPDLGPADLNPQDQFTPPDPGPIRLPADAISRAAWAGAIGGPLLVMVAFVLGLGTFIAGIGVAAFVAGFVTLIVRLPDRERGEDDGAVV